jgi:cystathionine beta-lyase
VKGAAQGARALVFNDNTWATPLYFQPLRHGADVAIQAATKYIVGHSDAMLGVVTANADAWERLHDGFVTLGTNPGSEEVFLGLRGLRTLEVRLERHMRNALEIAAWLQQRPEVEEVLYPALPSSPGHDLWKRDFSGASGLFSVTLRTGCAASLAAMIDGLEYFGIGFSWGGYESLILPFDVSGYRSVRKWDSSKLALRLHIGLEDPGDLKADLEAGFERLKSAG